MTLMSNPIIDGLEVKGVITTEFSKILTPEALQFIAKLASKFSQRREELLTRRIQVQEKLESGSLPDFLPETSNIRNGQWSVAPQPQDLQDRRVEITGPVDRKMVINALNSGANVFMADLEDSHCPTWNATINGQINLYDAVRKTISFTSPDGKKYSLSEKTATLFVRPRGWHMVEKNVLFNGRPLSGSLFDFGLFFFHNAKELIKRGTGPYFYLPKMESHLEARLWNDVFNLAQDELKIPRKTIKATVLIETILAAFEMDEILYELRDHSVGLNCGRWDYIFSFIKKFSHRPDFVLPDRSAVTMNQHFLKSYCELLVQTCHKRGTFAMGGMAAQIPIKNDPEANAIAMDKVLKDKEREIRLGHDGTWVAHPGLVPIARKAFDAIRGPNQFHVLQEGVKITAADLLKVPDGQITDAGVRTNIDVGLQYLEAWLRGLGCVPIHHLMEDAATAEISRAQLWQWIKHGRLSIGVFRERLGEVLNNIRATIGDNSYAKSRFELASRIFIEITTAPKFREFLTLAAYEHIDTSNNYFNTEDRHV